MRKIISKTEEEKKRRRNQTIIGILLIAVMFGSVFGIIANSFGNRNNSSEKINYNGIDFVKQGEFWFAQIEGVEFAFRNNPEEVENIPVSLNDLQNYYQQPLYIQSENYQAQYEIDQNLNRVFQRMQKACFRDEGNLSFDASFFEINCEETSPEKNCDDNFIIIKNSSESNILQENNCVFIQAPEENLTKVTDEFLFRILGIKQ